jgi:hypothetical protein
MDGVPRLDGMSRDPVAQPSLARPSVVVVVRPRAAPFDCNVQQALETRDRLGQDRG